MAAQQCVRNEELNSKDKETLDELVKVAESELTEDTKKRAVRLACEHEATDLNDQRLRWSFVRTVAGALKTFTLGTLNLHDQHTWGGLYLKSPPDTLSLIDVGAFVMTSFSTPSGGLLYTGKNMGETDCGWLVAWVNSSGGQKVYAECGRKSKFVNVNWDQVQTNLKNRGKTIFTCTDSTTNTSVYVTIQGAGDQYAVPAIFRG